MDLERVLQPTSTNYECLAYRVFSPSIPLEQRSGSRDLADDFPNLGLAQRYNSRLKEKNGNHNELRLDNAG